MRWEQRDLNPPQRISSETAHQMGSLQDCNGSALQLVINFSKPTRRHSRATGARDTTKLYYTPLCYPKHQFFACRRARFRRRNFFLRHFQRWLPVFFQAREPRFMVNSPPTCLPYMRASGDAGTLVLRSTAQHFGSLLWVAWGDQRLDAEQKSSIS